MTQQDDRTSDPAEKRAPSETGENDNKTSGYGNREDRENPEKGLQQSGTRQAHDLPGEGTRVGDDERRQGRADSQNAARIADCEDRPSR